MEKIIQYSIIIPVYNSELTLGELITRLIAVFLKTHDSYELIFVDDCSTDKSWEILKKYHTEDSSVKIIHLQKNFGQHNAVLCGLNYASGKYVITLDDDLQHPPEEIPKLIDKITEGFSAVYGKYQVKQHSKTENFFSTRFQTFIHWILDIPSSIFISSFAIYKADIVKNMIQIKSSYVFLPALLRKSVPADKIANVIVFHNPRKVGKSNYTLHKYFSLSLNLIINYSVLPLLIVGIFGIVISAMSFCYGGYIILKYLMHPSETIMGWNSIMVAITFLGGMILFSIAIIGEYLRRILTEVSYGQQYVIGEMEL